MGAGAGVSVKTSDFTEYRRKGADFSIAVGESDFGSYYWGMRCSRTGYIVVKDFVSQLKDLSWVDRIHGYDEGWPDKITELIASVDWDKTEFGDGYESKLEFMIGGGYIRSCLKHGFTLTLDSQYYYSLNVFVNVPATTKDGREVELSGYWYPFPMEFRASDQFVDMYEWCWDNEGGDFVAEMYDHEEFASPEEKDRFIEDLYSEGWNTVEQEFNYDRYYDSYGFVSPCLKRTGKRLSKLKGKLGLKRESWMLRRSSQKARAVCPECGSDKCEKETDLIRRRGEYPAARKSVHLRCTECGYHWSTKATMKESRKIRLFGRK